MWTAKAIGFLNCSLLQLQWRFWTQQHRLINSWYEHG